MARLHRLLAAVITLGTQVPSMAEDAARPEEQPTFDRETYDERNKLLNRLIGECIELSRSAAIEKKERKTVPDETISQLEELHLQIQKLEGQQDEETLKLQAAQSTGSKETAATAEPTPGDPSDVYFQGWLLSRDAEKLREKGKLAESREKLERAIKLFEQVAKEHPDWKPDMVQSRLKKAKNELSALPLAGG
jgi:hypothetical protein